MKTTFRNKSHSFSMLCLAGLLATQGIATEAFADRSDRQERRATRQENREDRREMRQDNREERRETRQENRRERRKARRENRQERRDARNK